MTAGWGHYGSGDVVRPFQGRIAEREYTADERACLCRARHGRQAALEAAIPVLDAKTLDVYLNDRLPAAGRCLLAQRPRRDLGLQARRLSDPQEMAVLPRT